MNILQITNHGLHDWRITPGLPDTGGQNVYVNHVADALVRLGHRVTVVNRGGYRHPLTGDLRVGTRERHGGRARIVYLTDAQQEFVRKEDMADRLPELADCLAEVMAGQGFELVISHYWDGAMLGLLANDRLAQPIPHIWVPHSVGVLKRRNVDPDEWERLRIDERIEAERHILARVDGVAATSSVIRDCLRRDYGHEARYFLPPGVDQDRYRPRAPDECEEIWEFLSRQVGGRAGNLRHRRLLLEVSRTDTTKRKDVLIRAFAALRLRYDNAFLAVTIDGGNRVLHDKLLGLIEELDLTGDVAVLGSVWPQLPCLHATAEVYCTPSVMEGFGMSAQEAAASGTPVVASDRVPFATEYLLGRDPVLVPIEGGGNLQVGEGGIVVPADSPEGFAAALAMLFEDDALRATLGEAARRITVPAFGWDQLVGTMMMALETAGGT